MKLGQRLQFTPWCVRSRFRAQSLMLVGSFALMFSPGCGADPVEAEEKYTTIAYWSNTSLVTGRVVTERTWGTHAWTTFPLDSIDLSCVDILVYFCNYNNVLTTEPWLSIVGGGTTPDSAEYAHGHTGAYPYAMDSLVARVHRAKKKVLMSVVDLPGKNFAAVLSDPGSADGFAESIAQYARRHGFDGVDVNIEANYPPGSHAARFFRLLRQKLNRAFAGMERRIITVVPPPGAYQWLHPSFGADSAITYYLPQCYAFSWAYQRCRTPAGGTAWPPSAYSAGHWPPCMEAGGVLSGAAMWIQAGFSPKKIIPGVWGANYTNNGTDTVGGPVARGALGETARWYTRRYQIGNGLTYGFDSSASKWGYYAGTVRDTQPLIGWNGPGAPSGTKQIVFVAGDMTARWLAHAVDSLRLGGAFTFSLDREFDKAFPPGRGRLIMTERLRYWLDHFSK